jgi:hypothetical protein
METKKTILTLFLITSAIIVSAQQSTDSINSQTEIFSSEGIGEIKIYKTTLSDFKKKYPECKVERYREKIGYGFSTSARAVYIENRGIYYFFERKKWFGDFYVRAISIDSTFKGKTSTGVGIGSTYNEIVAEFGKNDIKGLQSGGEKVSFLYYDKSPASITFRCRSIKADTISFKVDEIYINGW